MTGERRPAATPPDAALAGPSGREGPHAFVDALDHLELEDADRHHLERVLRLRVGDPLTVSDGAGRWRACRFGPVLDPVGPIVTVPAPAPPITVAFALTKGEKPELAVQKLTEVGVDRIVPFIAERSVVRWDADRAARNVERLRRIAREASMQCRRVWLPQVDDVVTFAEAASLPGAALAERDGAPPSLDHPTVLVGPEGGWSEAERTQDRPTIALGSLVLRAETAAVVAGAVLGALRAQLVAPLPSGSPRSVIA